MICDVYKGRLIDMKTRLRLFVFILMFFVLLNGFNSVLAESDTSEDDLLTLKKNSM